MVDGESFEVVEDGVLELWEEVEEVEILVATGSVSVGFPPHLQEPTQRRMETRESKREG